MQNNCIYQMKLLKSHKHTENKEKRRKEELLLHLHYSFRSVQQLQFRTLALLLDFLAEANLIVKWCQVTYCILQPLCTHRSRCFRIQIDPWMLPTQCALHDMKWHHILQAGLSNRAALSSPCPPRVINFAKRSTQPDATSISASCKISNLTNRLFQAHFFHSNIP